MATNLVTEISDVLSPSVVTRIASALGLNQTSTQKAVVAAVPAVLAALISYVSKPQGAVKLSDVAAKQDPGILSSLASVIGTPGQTALISQGGSVLSSLLGGKTFSALTGAVGQYASVDGAGSKNLLGLLGPVVLGVLGQEQRSKSLNAFGLEDLLTSQKSHVIGALPSGFSKYLSDTGILDEVTASSPKASRSAAATSPSILPWLLGVLVALAIGALIWHLFSRSHQTEATGPSAEQPAQTNTSGEAPYAGLFSKLQGIKAGDVDVGQLVTSAVNDLYSSLTGIKDEATAQSMLPTLTKSSSEFDQLSGLLNQLSPENRKLLAETFASIKPNLDQLLDKALALPGVGTIIKPTVDTIRSKLNALSTT
jgi:Bacterial protein of unknown function (DUF937)